MPSVISTLNEIRKGGLKEGLNVFKTKRQQQGVNRILELLEQAGEDPDEIIKALEVEATGKEGTIIDDKKMIIACKKNAVQILELKKEGKKLMQVNEFLKGNKIKIGQILS